MDQLLNFSKVTRDVTKSIGTEFDLKIEEVIKDDYFVYFTFNSDESHYITLQNCCLLIPLPLRLHEKYGVYYPFLDYLNGLKEITKPLFLGQVDQSYPSERIFSFVFDPRHFKNELHITEELTKLLRKIITVFEYELGQRK
jgi:hypothetical protein